MNAHTRMSAKGQVVIPKAVRERLCWSEGDRLDVIPTANGVLLRKGAQARQTITVDELMTLMPAHEGPRATLDEMNEAIDRARAERWAAKEARSK
jgi:AbrB family looped-hinge helix DNA binding protein